MSSSFEKIWAAYVASYFGTGSEKNNIASKIPALWAEFLPHLQEIPARVAGECFGVIAQTLDEDRLIYTAAAPVEISSAPLPSGMRRTELAHAEYAIFEHRGPVSQVDHTVSYA
jgi:AraC family transcriptional regulator